MNIAEIRKLLAEASDDEFADLLEDIAIAHVVGLLLGALGRELALQTVAEFVKTPPEEKPS